ncbi:hypothetical protein BLL42_05280 [Pseudomonas frederiksbergensis]|uniref:Uncharacterized protein n=1 Tax=Pseudomonas frederiksbergensis TaxID=104087 RepID=A0A1J0EGP6_9PSED|nr:hypothetical protein BLL42_05280 [Pseudomonas frederiksbergensis]
MQLVGNLGAVIGVADRGDRRDLFRVQCCYIACGQRALAMADQIDLGGARFLQNAVDLFEQFFTAFLICRG